MISIIICSRDTAVLQQVSQSVQVTIGVPYEIIAIDNSAGRYGICEAYNLGAAQSQYDILCFMHEDIEFRTDGWGKLVNHTLRDNSIGIVGVTGGRWLLNAPGTWWSCGTKYLTSNIFDHSPSKGYSQHTYSNPEGKLLVDVAAVDGLWLCTRKEVWQKYPFDSKNFPGFHFYDVDFCATIIREYRICVTVEITVAHFSLGSYNDSWFTYADVFYQKHRKYLPLGELALSPLKNQQKEYEACKIFMLQLIDKKFNPKTIYKYFLRCVLAKPFSRDTFWLARYYLKFAWRTMGS